MTKTHKPVWYEGPPFKKVTRGIKGMPGRYKKSKCHAGAPDEGLGKKKKRIRQVED